VGEIAAGRIAAQCFEVSFAYFYMVPAGSGRKVQSQEPKSGEVAFCYSPLLRKSSVVAYG